MTRARSGPRNSGRSIPSQPMLMQTSTMLTMEPRTPYESQHELGPKPTAPHLSTQSAHEAEDRYEGHLVSERAIANAVLRLSDGTMAVLARLLMPCEAAA